MSSSEHHRQSKRVKCLCAACRERKARFRFRGEVRADRDHTLCFACYRAEVNRARARRMTETPRPLWTPSWFVQQSAGHGRIRGAAQFAVWQQTLDHVPPTSAVMA
jgi:hypothetical protein